MYLYIRIILLHIYICGALKGSSPGALYSLEAPLSFLCALESRFLSLQNITSTINSLLKKHWILNNLTVVQTHHTREVYTFTSNLWENSMMKLLCYSPDTMGPFLSFFHFSLAEKTVGQTGVRHRRCFLKHLEWHHQITYMPHLEVQQVSLCS